jgi:hypothetical protein
VRQGATAPTKPHGAGHTSGKALRKFPDLSHLVSRLNSGGAFPQPQTRKKQMKTVSDFKVLSPEGRVTNLKSRVTKATTAKKEIMKLLIAGEECGDFGSGKGEMNAYALKITGHDLRREIQGTYEGCNVLRAIRSGKLAMTEDEFDSKPFGSFPLIMLSGFMTKSPENVSEALEIIRSGIDVTKRLQALRGPSKKTDPAPETGAGGSGGGGEAGGPAASSVTSTPGKTYFVPEGTPMLNCPEIVAQIIAEVKGAGSIADVEEYLKTFLTLSSYAESRGEQLEAEKPAELATAA